jgi:hypothetical protein
VAAQNQNVDKNVHSEGQAQEVSGENEDTIRNWITGHSWCILVNNLSMFFPASETMSEAELKVMDRGHFKTA